MRGRSVWLVTLALLTACAYYNGLWRANRLASEAERAEREGRTGQARSFWIQASVKAETVIVRHPGSRWLDDALLLRGRSLAKVQQCSQAVEALERARLESLDTDIREQATLIEARCRIELRQPIAARNLVEPITESPNPLRASEAYYLHGVASATIGQFDAAIRDFERSSDAGARLELLVSVLAVGRVDDARSLFDTVIAVSASEEDWERVFALLGAVDAEAAVAGLDRLVAEPGALTTGAVARLFVSEGVRARDRGDTAAALDVWGRVFDVAPDSTEERFAGVYMAAIRLARATSRDEAAATGNELDSIARVGGGPSRVAARLSRATQRVVEPTDEATQLLFYAELARDTLSAGYLASQFLLELVQRWPESLFAPKAALAVSLLRPALADSLRDVVTTRYPGSPYVLALLGRFTDTYTQLEDSLLSLTGQGTLGVLAATRRARPVFTGPDWVPDVVDADRHRRERFD